MTDLSTPQRPAGDVDIDLVVPFQVDALDARGRVVLLGDAIDQILTRHDYPEPVAKLLAEMCVLTVLIGTSLKFEGKFIIQTLTDGPVSMLVVDIATPDAIRAYARYDADAVAAMGEDASSENLLGNGTLALTVDQGQYMQRYQGIVQLQGASLEEVAHNYFRQSEQIPTQVRLAVGREIVPAKAGGSNARWRAGGIIAQFLPSSEDRMRQADLHPGEAPEGTELPQLSEDDAWTELKSLVLTVDDAELLDHNIGAQRLLYRLFHERGVTVYDGQKVRDKCSCSHEKVENVLLNMTAEERAEASQNGNIEVVCEFCSTKYTFDPLSMD